MAEIKSTLDMVLERAAKMGGGAPADLTEEENIKEGMRLGASYLRGDASSLSEVIASCADGQKKKALQTGAVRTLLRNIFLPRDETQQQGADKAMQGLVEVGQADGELLRACGEIKKLLDGYRQHREHLKQQLEGQFAQQMEMLEKNLSQQTGMSMKLQPSQHPKFQEEWGRIKDELSRQYGRALEQQKKMLEEWLTGAAAI